MKRKPSASARRLGRLRLPSGRSGGRRRRRRTSPRTSRCRPRKQWHVRRRRSTRPRAPARRHAPRLELRPSSCSQPRAGVGHDPGAASAARRRRTRTPRRRARAREARPHLRVRQARSRRHGRPAIIPTCSRAEAATVEGVGQRPSEQRDRQERDELGERAEPSRASSRSARTPGTTAPRTDLAADERERLRQPEPPEVLRPAQRRQVEGEPPEELAPLLTSALGLGGRARARSKELFGLRRPGGLLEHAAGAAAEVAEVDATLFGGRGEPFGEVERLVEHRARRRGRPAPISMRIVRSVREATIGSGTPSTQTRVRRPCPRSAPSSGSSA